MKEAGMKETNERMNDRRNKRILTISHYPESYEINNTILQIVTLI